MKGLRVKETRERSGLAVNRGLGSLHATIDEGWRALGRAGKTEVPVRLFLAILFGQVCKPGTNYGII